MTTISMLTGSSYLTVYALLWIYMLKCHVGKQVISMSLYDHKAFQNLTDKE